MTSTRPMKLLTFFAKFEFGLAQFMPESSLYADHSIGSNYDYFHFQYTNGDEVTKLVMSGELVLGGTWRWSMYSYIVEEVGTMPFQSR